MLITKNRGNVFLIPPDSTPNLIRLNISARVLVQPYNLGLFRYVVGFQVLISP